MLDDLDYLDEMYHLLPAVPSSFKWRKIKSETGDLLEDPLSAQVSHWKLELSSSREISLLDSEEEKLLSLRIVEHAVGLNDTLQGISLKYNVNLAEIKRLNHLSTNIIHKKKILLLVNGKLSDLYKSSASTSAKNPMVSSPSRFRSGSGLSITLPAHTQSSSSFFSMKNKETSNTNSSNYFNLSERCIGISCTNCYSSPSKTSPTSSANGSPSLPGSAISYLKQKNDFFQYFSSFSSASSPTSKKCSPTQSNHTEASLFLPQDNSDNSSICTAHSTSDEAQSVPLLF